MEQLSEQKLSELTDKWLKGTITAEEDALLEAWYNAPANNIDWTADEPEEEQLAERMFSNIHNNIIDNNLTGFFTSRKSWFKVAASIAVLLGAGIGYLSLKQPLVNATVAATNHSDVHADGNYNKAVLTLANGQTVQLDDAANGVIAQDGGTNIKKTNDGEIAYNAGAGKEASATNINIISTPKGGQYHISLPDGSRVWLNALSALKFPTAFNGEERVVELTGEAYFEVKKDKNLPFKVKMADGTSIAVLGTHFNVMAYPNEHSVEATLLEGSIKVQKGGLHKLVIPGEMAEVTDNIVLKKVNVEDVLSWKNGLFRFDKANVNTVMNEIARWYNVEVTYENGMPDNEITGFMSRTSQLNEVVKMLELSGLRLEFRGNKIKVFKN